MRQSPMISPDKRIPESFYNFNQKQTNLDQTFGHNTDIQQRVQKSSSQRDIKYSNNLAFNRQTGIKRENQTKNDSQNQQFSARIMNNLGFRQPNLNEIEEHRNLYFGQNKDEQKIKSQQKNLNLYNKIKVTLSEHQNDNNFNKTKLFKPKSPANRLFSIEKNFNQNQFQRCESRDNSSHRKTFLKAQENFYNRDTSLDNLNKSKNNFEELYNSIHNPQLDKSQSNRDLYVFEKQTLLRPQISKQKQENIRLFEVQSKQNQNLTHIIHDQDDDAQQMRQRDYNFPMPDPIYKPQTQLIRNINPRTNYNFPRQQTQNKRQFIQSKLIQQIDSSLDNIQPLNTHIMRTDLNKDMNVNSTRNGDVIWKQKHRDSSKDEFTTSKVWGNLEEEIGGKQEMRQQITTKNILSLPSINIRDKGKSSKQINDEYFIDNEIKTLCNITYDDTDNEFIKDKISNKQTPSRGRIKNKNDEKEYKYPLSKYYDDQLQTQSELKIPQIKSIENIYSHSERINIKEPESETNF